MARTRSIKKRKSDEENHEEDPGGKKQHVEELEPDSSLSECIQQNPDEGMIAGMNDSLLWFMMRFLQPHEIIACLSVCNQWQLKLDVQAFWKQVARRHFGPFVTQMESMAGNRNGTEVDYKQIAKGLSCVKPLRRKVENDDSAEPRVLALSDIFVIVHIRDKASGTDIQLYCKSFQEIIHESPSDFKIVFEENELEPLLLPFQLSGEFRDYFRRPFEECRQFPERVADDLGVSVRLWRTDKQQAVCLCHDQGHDEVAGFQTKHRALTLFPFATSDHEGENWLLRRIQCSILPTYPPSYYRGWKEYDIDDWKHIQYSIGSFELSIAAKDKFGSVGDILEWLNALNWE
mmetsp:Transcript_36860/g.89516  ORF Transcript_36860/g.89516 Transcript_36860/m.89516 type:complete len:346 (-) Transcript_36860:581-1618(-)